MYICNMQYKESEFYKEVLRLIDTDLNSKSLKVIDLLDKDYIISRTQYYNIKKVSEGNKTISRLSYSRLKEICGYLEIKINELLFDAEIKDSQNTN